VGIPFLAHTELKANPKLPPPITAIRTGYGGGTELAFIDDKVRHLVEIAIPLEVGSLPEVDFCHVFALRCIDSASTTVAFCETSDSKRTNRLRNMTNFSAIAFMAAAKGDCT
jgi:hypothetical protein